MHFSSILALAREYFYVDGLCIVEAIYNLWRLLSIGRMQTIPNALVCSLKNEGGEILYKRCVEKILVSNKKVKG